MATLCELAEARRSCALMDMSGDPPPAALVRQWIAAAIAAPNHRLTFPWRFTVLAGDDRHRVGQAFAREQVEAGRIPPAAAEREAQKLARAPLVILVSAATEVDQPVRYREDLCAVAAAVQTLLLAAQDSGYATMWRTGALMESQAVRKLLGLAANEQLVAAVYVGRPDPRWQPGPRRRPPVDTVTRWGLAHAGAEQS